MPPLVARVAVRTTNIYFFFFTAGPWPLGGGAAPATFLGGPFAVLGACHGGRGSSQESGEGAAEVAGVVQARVAWEAVMGSSRSVMCPQLLLP